VCDKLGGHARVNRHDLGRSHRPDVDVENWRAFCFCREEGAPIARYQEGKEVGMDVWWRVGLLVELADEGEVAEEQGMWHHWLSKKIRCVSSAKWS